MKPPLAEADLLAMLSPGQREEYDMHLAWFGMAFVRLNAKGEAVVVHPRDIRAAEAAIGDSK